MNDRFDADSVETVGALVVGLAALAVAGLGLAVHADAFTVTNSTFGTLGAAFVVLAMAFGGLVAPSARPALAEAWREHRRYVGFAAGLFAFGALLGILVLAAGVNFLEMIVEMFEDELVEEGAEIELTARFFVLNNTPPFVLSILGAASLGLLTAVLMLFNGFIVGHLGAAVGQAIGFDFILVALLPHGVFELPALFIASGVGFRLIHRLAQRVLGRRESFVTRAYLYRTGVLVLFGWLLLVLAAFVEAYITGALLDVLFGERLDGLEAAANESASEAVAAIVSVLPF